MHIISGIFFIHESVVHLDSNHFAFPLCFYETTVCTSIKEITGLEKAHFHPCGSVVFSTQHLSILSHWYIPKCRLQTYFFSVIKHIPASALRRRRDLHTVKDIKRKVRGKHCFYEQVFPVLCSEEVWALKLTVWVRKVCDQTVKGYISMQIKYINCVVLYIDLEQWVFPLSY